MPSRAQSAAERNEKASVAAAYNELLQAFSTCEVDTVGNYVLGSLIGKGSFGKVYKATHLPTSATVVVKCTPKTEAANLAREIYHHRRLHHPHIARLFEYICTEENAWLVMEYCSGGELFDYLCRKKRLPEDEVKRLFAQICGAVGYVHSKGCVHRDLKLENILLDKHGNVKLVDFGFTRENDPGKFLETWAGTTAYAPPEMIMGGKYAGEAADAWSTGVILHTLLTGELPFDDDDEQNMRKKIISDDIKIPMDISEHASALIRMLLNKDPVRRPTIQQVLVHPFLAEHGPNQLLSVKATWPVPFTAARETELLEKLSVVGVDTKKMQASVKENKCDLLAGWWWLAWEEEEKKARRRKRKEEKKLEKEVQDDAPKKSNRGASDEEIEKLKEAAKSFKFPPGSVEDKPLPDIKVEEHELDKKGSVWQTISTSSNGKGRKTTPKPKHNRRPSLISSLKAWLTDTNRKSSNVTSLARLSTEPTVSTSTGSNSIGNQIDEAALNAFVRSQTAPTREARRLERSGVPPRLALVGRTASHNRVEKSPLSGPPSGFSSPRAPSRARRPSDLRRNSTSSSVSSFRSIRRNSHSKASSTSSNASSQMKSGRSPGFVNAMTVPVTPPPRHAMSYGFPDVGGSSGVVFGRRRRSAFATPMASRRKCKQGGKGGWGAIVEEEEEEEEGSAMEDHFTEGDGEEEEEDAFEDEGRLSEDHSGHGGSLYVDRVNSWKKRNEDSLTASS
ncbi:kinase-like protein [Saitoella complicata NRRL Y-17804]|uniref:kinase-like protein n=1 Tax=Saitoella complicata (strain BCRC 22490 / CBS 7301 / JCM 7358 / NBRC 10748 / NRRL Y-17804) TaxID=698492 RepID=UPI000867EC1C|nr:kinase-like protein [Saitoella complicata NRRL Y-17804]ODQ51717.1 kinase-like protein [Saitoella complicata NRRL Y-17804]